MAASLCRRTLLNYKNIFHIQKRTGYVVLIPESPEEVSDFNIVSLESLPDFSHLTTKNCTFILNQYAQQYDVGSWEIHEHLDKLIKSSETIDIFKNVIEPLEVLTVPLLTSWGVTRTLYVANRDLMPIKSFSPMSDRFFQIRNDKFDKKPFYFECKKQLESNSSQFSEEQKRVMQKFIWEGFNLGFDLDLKKRGDLRLMYESLENIRKQYEVKYMNSITSFKKLIVDPNFKNEIPLDLMRNASVNENNPEKGPWIISLQKSIYSRYLEYCNSREARYHLWITRNQVASRFLDSSCNGTFEVETIRKKRREVASILGFDSYAHMSMKTKMAGTVENVQIVLSQLLESARFGQERELYDLEKFAYEHKFEGQIELWDVSYWKRKEREIRFGLVEHKLREYFPVGQVLLGLFALCEQLFGIEIEEQTGVDTWHPDVRYFRISDEKTKTILGGFYFDPYARPNKMPAEGGSGWLIPIRPRCGVIASLPLCALVFSFSPPTDDEPSLLYFREVEFFFEKFGHMLQFILTQTYYSEVAGLSNIEWDAVDVCSNFLKCWLSEKGTLESITGHYKTGEPLPSHLLENLSNIHKHMAGTTLSQQIYYSNLDLFMHMRGENLVKIMTDLWPQHFLFSLNKKDCHPFGFKEVILMPYAASIYGIVWSKMVAADLFWAFTEAGLDNHEEVSALGRKFRATYLSSGGASHPAEVFRRFRGRDPDPKSLISFLDLPTAAYFEPGTEPKLSLPENK